MLEEKKFLIVAFGVIFLYLGYRIVYEPVYCMKPIGHPISETLLSQICAIIAIISLLLFGYFNNWFLEKRGETE